MVVFQFANDIRAGKKVCYTLSRCPHRLAAKDATLSRWISRVRIPLGAPQNLRSPLPIRWRAFCYPCAGIRTRQGAELRKREAFSSAARKERSDAAKAGGVSRTRTSRRGHHLKREARYPRGSGLFATHASGFEPDRVRIPASSQGLWAKNSKYEYCYQFSNSDFMPSEGDLDARGPTAEELQAFISYVLGHMLRNNPYFVNR